MEDLRISLIQADLHWEELEANLAMFEELIWSIEDTDLIVLPEMFTTGFSMNVEKLSEPPGGKTFKWMRQMASQRNAAIVGSYIVRDKGNFFNRLYFVFPDGSSQQYDKKHLFNLANEGEHYTAGNQRQVIGFKGWKICPLICYDLRFPVWARSTARVEDLYEYDLLLFVANWPDTRIHAWDTLLQARAIENQSYCAGVNRIGADAKGKDYTGHSALYSPLGEELLFSKGEEEVLTYSLSYKDLEKYRKAFPFQKDADSFEMN
ncbi:MAG: amidohydrolase [Ekhidna sp.]|nr:amidohydrolase [Ekhidna sp.]